LYTLLSPFLEQKKLPPSDNQENRS
jgi:hypothetical protein